MFTGGVGPRGPSDGGYRSQTRGRQDTEVHGVPRQPENLAASHKQRATRRSGLLHVSSEHGPHDEPGRLPASSR